MSYATDGKCHNSGVYKVTLGAAVWYLTEAPGDSAAAIRFWDCRTPIPLTLAQAELIAALRPGAFLEFDVTCALTGGRPARCRIERRESIPVPSSASPSVDVDPERMTAAAVRQALIAERGHSAVLRDKLREAIDAWPQFDDPDAPVNGGDMVEWFGEWRREVIALLPAGDVRKAEGGL